MEKNDARNTVTVNPVKNGFLPFRQKNQPDNQGEK
jgi:hypothetical protein